MPKYSILIPVYNKPDCLEKCLNSVQMQTYEDYEIIVIDDCSTDSKVGLCLQQFSRQCSKVNIYMHEKNCGIGETRNELLSMAKGEYIIFVDSDDYIENNLLETIDSYVNQDVEVIRYQNIIEPACENQRLKEMNKNPFRLCASPTDIISGEDAMLMWCSGVNKINMLPWSYCVKSSLYENLQFPNIKVLEDYCVIPAVLARAKKVQSINFCGYHYMLYDKSLTKKDDLISELEYRLEKLQLLEYVTEITLINLMNIGCSANTIELYGIELKKRLDDKRKKIKLLYDKLGNVSPVMQ